MRVSNSASGKQTNKYNVNDCAFKSKQKKLTEYERDEPATAQDANAKLLTDCAAAAVSLIIAYCV